MPLLIARTGQSCDYLCSECLRSAQCVCLSRHRPLGSSLQCLPTICARRMTPCRFRRLCGQVMLRLLLDRFGAASGESHVLIFGVFPYFSITISPHLCPARFLHATPHPSCVTAIPYHRCTCTCPHIPFSHTVVCRAQPPIQSGGSLPPLHPKSPARPILIPVHPLLSPASVTQPPYCFPQRRRQTCLPDSTNDSRLFAVSPDARAAVDVPRKCSRLSPQPIRTPVEHASFVGRTSSTLSCLHASHSWP